eukprot:8329230-Ditylum_brightwellii.AAC.1
MKWMQEKGILKHWILPEQGLNKGASGTHFSHCNTAKNRQTKILSKHAKKAGPCLPEDVQSFPPAEPSHELGGRSAKFKADT